MWKEVEQLKKKWKKAIKDKKTKKSFKDYYSAKERNYLCDYPTFTDDGFSVLNLPPFISTSICLII